jgi:hypothetical protein
MKEQWTSNPMVAGSNPVGAPNFFYFNRIKKKFNFKYKIYK